ncbi:MULTISPECIES: hypothetical protein [Cellulomonas]|uniref:Uncharacterized protein n=1 Tax=Cellulomonas uda TaxID=1714 RepID=A0A4Y3KFU7_CELUD|nr:MULTISPECIES: hypothetical protein [Cellulomonas]ASR55639.1 hypothetical protein CBP52_11660 [Cellulomonas sp. PSBB021]NII66711.1 hypothetical protein [Cellulomonas uda]GEA81780.1 hypothetical protein CUD01_22240 [Cellulomonas uda]
MGEDVPGLQLFTELSASDRWLRTRHEPTADDRLRPGRVLARVAEHYAATAEVVPPRPEPGSPLAEDDAALGIYVLSHGVALAHGVAMDHLEAIRGTIQDAQRTHPWAEHTLARAALESACTALWLIGPDDPAERRHRRVRQLYNNSDEGRKASKLLGGDKLQSGRTFDEVLEEFRSLAPDSRSVKSWTYRDVVRGAAQHCGSDSDLFELLWRIQSGLAHGKSWATLATLEQEVTGTADGVAEVRFTTDVEQLMPVVAITLNTCVAAWGRYLELARAPRP